MSRRALNEEAMSIPFKCVIHAKMEKRDGIYTLLVTLTYRETVHKTQPFGKLKQTLSKKQQENGLANFNC